MRSLLYFLRTMFVGAIVVLCASRSFAAAPDPVGPWCACGQLCDCPNCPAGCSAVGCLCATDDAAECSTFSRNDQNHTHYCSRCGAAWGGTGHGHNCPYCGEFNNVVNEWGVNAHEPTRQVGGYSYIGGVWVASASAGAPPPVVAASTSVSAPIGVRTVYVKDCRNGGCSMIPIQTTFAPNGPSVAPIGQTAVYTGTFPSVYQNPQWAQSYAIQTSVSESAVGSTFGARLAARPVARLATAPLRIATAPFRLLVRGVRGGCGG